MFSLSGYVAPSLIREIVSRQNILEIENALTWYMEVLFPGNNMTYTERHTIHEIVFGRQLNSEKYTLKEEEIVHILWIAQCCRDLSSADYALLDKVQLTGDRVIDTSIGILFSDKCMSSWFLIPNNTSFFYFNIS